MELGTIDSNERESVSPDSEKPDIMKIGIVCYPSIGGSGVVASELGKGLQERGHEIHFFSYDLPHRLDGSEDSFVFHHVDVPLYPVFRFPPYTLALATKIAEAAEKSGLDLVHVHYAIPHSTSALLAKMMMCHYNKKRLRIITTLHGTDTDLVGKEPSYRPVLEYSINGSDAVTAVSQYLKKSTLEEFDVNRDIKVIYNPIDMSLFRPPEKKRPSPAGGEKTILHISNFRPVKRVVDAVRILDLVRNFQHANLLFLGEGPDLPMAERTARQLGLLDRVTFKGKVENVEEWLRNGDLLLSTSEMESFGMTIAEAMASELPVVAYRVGGVSEVMEDRLHGRLVDLGETCMAAKAIAGILADPALGERYGKEGRRRIAERFRLEKIAGEYEALYEEVMNQEPLTMKGLAANCFCG